MAELRTCVARLFLFLGTSQCVGPCLTKTFLETRTCSGVGHGTDSLLHELTISPDYSWDCLHNLVPEGKDSASNIQAVVVSSSGGNIAHRSP